MLSRSCPTRRVSRWFSLGLHDSGGKRKRTRWESEELFDKPTTSRLAKNRDLSMISAKHINILLDPLKCKSLVEQADVGFANIKLRCIRKAEDCEM